MPQVTNKITQENYYLTDKELEALQSNPVLAKAYTVTKADIPDEVKKMISESKEIEVSAKKKRNHKP